MAEAGIRTGGLVAPVLPGLTDSRAQLTETVHAIRDAGGTVLGHRPLYLRGATRDHFMNWLRQEDAALYERYRAAYAGRTELSREYRDWVKAAVRDARLSYPG